MLDNIRPRKRGDYLHPFDRDLKHQMVVGDRLRQNFPTPEDVAAKEEISPDTSTTGHLDSPAKPPKKTKRSLKQWLKNRTRLQWLLIGSAVLLVSGGAISAFLLLRSPPPPPVVAVHKKKPAPPKPTTVASRLTGLQVDPSVNERPVTGIMIENFPDARPQSGLDQAGIVFEAIAEGGITRFLTLWLDTEPDYIGPVRSVRPYYIQWAMGFDAAIAHAGGSPEALSYIKTWGAKDLDQFAGGAYFWRIASRYAPHNLYTSIAKLREYESQKGYGKANFTSLARKAESPSKAPTAKTINLNISSDLYNVHYDYDPGTNSYKRSEGGAPHMQITANGAQTQIAPKVVVVMVMAQGIEPDGKHTSYASLGSGHVYVFQDGLVTEGSWHKDNYNTALTLTDGNGKTLPLNPGQTWFTAVGGTDRVSYSP